MLQFKKLIVPLLLSLSLVILFEILSSAFLPIIGLRQMKFQVHILFILFLAFRMTGAFFPLAILSVSAVHGIFSIEGWALTSLIGILLGWIVQSVRGMFSLNSSLTIASATFVFYLIWNLIRIFLISFKTGSLAFAEGTYLSLGIELILVCILAPFIFQLFNKFWQLQEGSLVSGDV